MIAQPIDPRPAPRATPGMRLLGALATRDFATLERLLSADVWLRALLPRHLEERRGPGEVLAAFAAWYGGATTFDVVSLDHDAVGAKERVIYRFTLTPDWAPGEEHLIEQMAFLSIREGHVRKIDLVCTGFMPLGTATTSVPADAAPARR